MPRVFQVFTSSSVTCALLLSVASLTLFTGEALSTPKFKVFAVKSDLPVGAVVGKRRCSDGALDLFRSSCGTIVSKGMSAQAGEGYAQVITSTLSSAGLGGQTSSSIFSEVDDTPARYLVGVTLIDADINAVQKSTFPTGAYSWHSRGTITTRWEVYDNQIGKVVLTKELKSKKVKAPGESIGPVIHEGLKQLSQEFAQLPAVASLINSLTSASESTTDELFTKE